MDVLAAIENRRSIRRYADQAVAPELVERLLAAAVWAPSAHNRQPWRFAVLRAVDAKARLADAMGARLRADRLADGDDPEAVEADARRSRARLVAAPVVVLACLSMRDMDAYPDTRRKKAEYLMAAQSVAMAVQNLLLAAHAAGLGACWMCAPLFSGAEACAALGLPADWEPQAAITLGYPAGPGRPASRKPLAEMVAWK